MKVSAECKRATHTAARLESWLSTHHQLAAMMMSACLNHLLTNGLYLC